MSNQITDGPTDENTNAEQTRWQEAIYRLCCKSAPDLNIDGAGCSPDLKEQAVIQILREAAEDVRFWAEHPLRVIAIANSALARADAAGRGEK